MMNPIKMVKYMLVYRKLEPLLEQLGKEFQMKLSIHMLTQIIGTVGQVLNVVSGVVPQKYTGLVAGILAAAQTAIAAVAHFSNPDGTPAEAPYIKQ